MNQTISLIAAGSCGAIIAAWAAWSLTRKEYSKRLQQLALRHAQLQEAAARFERHSRQQIAALRAELAEQGARAESESASEMRMELERRAALEAALAEEASKPVRQEAAFADTEPLGSWTDTHSTRDSPFIEGRRNVVGNRPRHAHSGKVSPETS
jgi:predicted acylesterase/phospholipase RssA